MLCGKPSIHELSELSLVGLPEVTFAWPENRYSYLVLVMYMFKMHNHSITYWCTILINSFYDMITYCYMMMIILLLDVTPLTLKWLLNTHLTYIY